MPLERSKKELSMHRLPLTSLVILLLACSYQLFDPPASVAADRNIQQEQPTLQSTEPTALNGETWSAPLEAVLQSEYQAVTGGTLTPQ